MALVVVMGTWRLGGGRGGGGGGGRRAQRGRRDRARTRDARCVRARRPPNASASPPWMRARGVTARRSAPRKPARHLHPHSVRPAGPGVTARSRGRARGAGGRAPDHPRARPTRGWEPRARARSSPSRLWGTPVRPRRTIRDPTGWVFSNTRFSRGGFSRPRAPHDARRAGARARVSSSASHRGDCRAVVETPPTYGVRRVCEWDRAVRTKTRRKTVTVQVGPQIAETDHADSRVGDQAGETDWTGSRFVLLAFWEEEPSDSFFSEERKVSAGDVFADALAPAVRGYTLGTPDADARRGVGVHVQ